jgi:hypothetical protein
MYGQDLGRQVVDKLNSGPDGSVSEFILHAIIDDPPGSVSRRELHRTCIELVREDRLEIVDSPGKIRYRLPADEDD